LQKPTNKSKNRMQVNPEPLYLDVVLVPLTHGGVKVEGIQLRVPLTSMSYCFAQSTLFETSCRSQDSCSQGRESTECQPSLPQLSQQSTVVVPGDANRAPRKKQHRLRRKSLKVMLLHVPEMCTPSRCNAAFGGLRCPLRLRTPRHELLEYSLSFTPVHFTEFIL